MQWIKSLTSAVTSKGIRNKSQSEPDILERLVNGQPAHDLNLQSFFDFGQVTPAPEDTLSRYDSGLLRMPNDVERVFPMRYDGILLTPEGEIFVKNEQALGLWSQWGGKVSHGGGYHIIKPYALIRDAKLIPLKELAKHHKLLESYLMLYGSNDLELICRVFDRSVEFSQWDEWDASSAPVHKQIYSEVHRAVEQYVQPGASIFDIGAGIGVMVEQLSAKGYNVQGVEPNNVNVRIAQAAGRNVRKGTVQSLRHVHNQDVVLDRGVLTNEIVTPEYVERAIPLLIGALRPGGVFISAPFNESLLTAAALEAHGFDVVEKSNPLNLFNYAAPKQFYVAIKHQ